MRKCFITVAKIIIGKISVVFLIVIFTKLCITILIQYEYVYNTRFRSMELQKNGI